MPFAAVVKTRGEASVGAGDMRICILEGFNYFVYVQTQRKVEVMVGGAATELFLNPTVFNILPCLLSPFLPCSLCARTYTHIHPFFLVKNVLLTEI